MNKNLLLLISTVIVFKVLYNLYCLILAKWYYKNYIKFIKESDSWFIKEHRQRIISLFERAGICDTKIPVIEPGGYGYVKTGNISLFQKSFSCKRRYC